MSAQAQPWQYDATLTNAIPRGEIHATGFFGPWQTDSPGDSSVAGHYTFDHADLNTIKGIGGILSSVGEFKGQLDKIVVDGTTETPDFSLDTSNHPIPLHTRFHAIVDGTSGDTYLEPVNATLRKSTFSASGAVINIKGRGHTIELNVDVPHGQVKDFLDLAVKSEPAVMTGIISTKAKLHIRPGKERVAERLSLQGNFTLVGIHFSNPSVQDKVDMLSLRAQGEPEKAKPGAKDVNSRMTGTFSLNEGSIHFSKIEYVHAGRARESGGDLFFGWPTVRVCREAPDRGVALAHGRLAVAVRPAEGGALLQEKGRRSRDSSEDQRYQIGAEVRARRVRGKTETLGAKRRSQRQARDGGSTKLQSPTLLDSPDPRL